MELESVKATLTELVETARGIGGGEDGDKFRN